MVYCDNAATTLIKPPKVADALTYALANFGAAARAAHGASQAANHAVYSARESIAALVGAVDSMSVAFTSSATEALNLVIHGLVESGDRALASAAEHNSVLRPLYMTDASMDIIDCDSNGIIDLDHADRLISHGGVKLLAVTHGSNVTGAVTDVYALREICAKNGVILLLDVSQTLGVVPVSVDMADVICFTGHKGLFGPQGTGGVIVNPRLMDNACFRIVKTGGSGSNTFDKTQPNKIPDIFESGTHNSHAIYGLLKGVEFINETGLDAVFSHNKKLTESFLDRVRSMKHIHVYGEEQGRMRTQTQKQAQTQTQTQTQTQNNMRLPIVSLNIDGIAAADVAASLWDDYGIAVRAGFHCAPLMHKALGTEASGAVRFSFSYFNTPDDVKRCVAALAKIAAKS